MSFLSYQFSALSSLFFFSHLYLLSLLSPIPSLSSPFLPSLSIISHISSLNSLSSLPLSLFSPYPSLPSTILYPLILSLDTLTSVSPHHSPSFLFYLISLLFLPLSLPFSIFPLHLLNSLSPFPALFPLRGCAGG